MIDQGVIDQELLDKCLLKVSLSDPETIATAEFQQCALFVKVCRTIAEMARTAQELGFDNAIIAACGASFETGFNAGREYQKELEKITYASESGQAN